MITRREFIKIGMSVTAAAAAITFKGIPFSKISSVLAKEPKDTGTRKVATFCEICFWKCGMVATVENGTITKVEGNPSHPLSNGRLCPRGASALGIVYDKDRLKVANFH